MALPADLIFRQLFDQETWTYTYLLGDRKTKEAILIDPVKEQMERDLKLLNELGLKLIYILETHVHADHITSAGELRNRTQAQTILGERSGVDCADQVVKEGDIIKWGQFSLKALSTPGHTDGCMSYFGEGMVFTGDALLIRGCGRTDFQQGSPERLFESITQKLYTLPDEILVYPAHDYKGMMVSSIGEEKKFNARLNTSTSREEFVATMKSLKLADPKKIHEAVPANLQCGKTDKAI